MKKIFCYLSFMLVALAGCAIDEVDTFDTGYIYVDFGDTEYDITFQTYPGQTEIVYDLPVKIHGLAASEEREISISVDTATTAIEGVHYKLDEHYYFSADVIESTIPITLYLTDDMVDTTYTLVLNVGDIGDALRGEVVQTTLSIDDQLAQPDWWVDNMYNDIYNSFLGTYSREKYQYFILATGVVDLSEYSYLELLEVTLIFKEWLEAQDPKVVDADGNEIEIVI